MIQMIVKIDTSMSFPKQKQYKMKQRKRKTKRIKDKTETTLFINSLFDVKI